MITKFQAPPVVTPFFDANKVISDGWLRWFQQVSIGLSTQPIPANSASRGTPYQIAFDNDFLYICTENDTWRRIALSAF